MKTAFFQTIYFPNINAPTGATSPGLTAAFAVNTQGSPIAVSSGGTPIPLPNEQVLPSGVTANSTNTVFTVAEAGTYQISYHVNTTLALPRGTRLMINGVDNIASTIAPKIATSRFENQITVYLPANSTISLQMYPMTLAGDVFLAGGGVGASLTIIRLNGSKPDSPGARCGRRMGFRRRINASLQSQKHVHTPTWAGVCTCYVLRGGPAIVSVMIAKMGRACWPPPVCFWRGTERRFGGYGPYHTGFDERGWVENNIDVCCHRDLGHDQAVLLRTFAYDRPGPMPCEIGS